MTDLELLEMLGNVSYKEENANIPFKINGPDYTASNMYEDKSGNGLQLMTLGTHLTKQFMCIQFQNLREYFEKRDKMLVLSFVFM